MDGVHLSCKGKRILARELAEMTEGNLGLKKEGANTRLAREERRTGKPELGAKSAAQLKSIYPNAHNMGNKQEELKAILQQENYGEVAITEVQWDDSHDWSGAMDG
ncbi:hypothetical protein WISP_41094 [Willisornis vidua]|uniref:Uncharacterized protein n=1 Tax=Willisornis vidua TaxID=1566151 RepID=A0ABQ9DHN6_9PASS|nr:hypothetical protein WISP_41094 [Willisornis vidua]